MKKTITIPPITDQQKLEAADLENQLRALDEYIRNEEERLMTLQMEIEPNISAARIKQADIRKQLGTIRRVSDV